MCSRRYDAEPIHSRARFSASGSSAPERLADAPRDFVEMEHMLDQAVSHFRCQKKPLEGDVCRPGEHVHNGQHR